jgi:hypothetical protein
MNLEIGKLNQEAVRECNEIPQFATLSLEEIKNVVGGAQLDAAAHSHYSYWVCTNVGC